MNVLLFSVWDMAAKRYMDPFCAPTIEFAIRGFREACTTDGHQMQKFPEDYVLYHVGEFCAETGQLAAVPISKIAMAASYVNEEER